MESLNLDGPMRRIAAKHGIDLSKLDFNDLLASRDEREEQETIKFTQMNNKSKRSRTFQSSLVSDFEDLKQTFDDFNVTDDKQQKELNRAKNIATRIIQGETGNFTFSGPAGSGKTMLAISILNAINKSKCGKTCYFLSFEMFISKQKASFNDPALKKDIQKIEKCIQNCDVFVLDDLGSETFMQHVDKFKKKPTQASEFTQETLFRFADYRKSKTNIVTTNNSSTELQDIYNSKIYSRLIAKNMGNAIKFDSKDMRNIF